MILLPVPLRLYLAIVVSILVLGCSPMGGTITEESTGQISGKTVFTDFVRASHIAITLFSKTASSNSGLADIWKPAYTVTTDSFGAFSFDSLRNGMFLLEARTKNSLHAGCLINVVVSGPDTKKPELTLRPHGAIHGHIDASLLPMAADLQVFVQQLDTTVAVDREGYFRIPALPSFTYTLFLMKDNQVPGASDNSTTVAVLPGKTVVLRNFGSAGNAVLVDAPDAPEQLNALSITSSRVVLSWKASLAAEEYTLMKYNTDSGLFDTLAKTADTTFTDSTLAAGCSYSYVLRARNRGGISPESSVLSITTSRVASEDVYPRLSIVAPDNNIVYLSSEQIVINAHVAEPEGDISRTVVFIDGVPVDSAYGSGSFTWMAGPLAKGYYSVTVIAVAADSDTTVSAPLRVIVDDIRFGDVNMDGAIDYYDALDISRFSVGLELSVFNEEAADVSGNTVVDILDALMVDQYVKRYIDVFPRYTLMTK